MTDEQILEAILRREGGFSFHPDDRGKATNFGITMATLSEWRGTPVTVDDVRTLTREEACDIYRAKYIAPFADVEPELRPHAIDIAVNSGVSRARALLGAARQNANGRPLQTQLVIERLKFYARIVKGNPSQAVFFSGWVNRALEFLG